MPPERQKNKIANKMCGVHHAPHLSHGALPSEIVFGVAKRYAAIVAHGAPQVNFFKWLCSMRPL